MDESRRQDADTAWPQQSTQFRDRRPWVSAMLEHFGADHDVDALVLRGMSWISPTMSAPVQADVEREVLRGRYERPVGSVLRTDVQHDAGLQRLQGRVSARSSVILATVRLSGIRRAGYVSHMVPHGNAAHCYGSRRGRTRGRSATRSGGQVRPWRLDVLGQVRRSRRPVPTSSSQRIERWAATIRPRRFVLEISCADGFMTEALVRRGFQRHRDRPVAGDGAGRSKNGWPSAGLEADLRVADANTFEPDRTWDVLAGADGDLLPLHRGPRAALMRLSPASPRRRWSTSTRGQVMPGRAVDDLRSPGSPTHGVGARLRAEFDRAIGSAGRWALRTVGSIPPVRNAMLRRKFNVVAHGREDESRRRG